MLAIIGQLRFRQLEADLELIIVLPVRGFDRQIDRHQLGVHRHRRNAAREGHGLLEDMLSDDLVIVHDRDEPGQGQGIRSRSRPATDHDMDANTGPETFFLPAVIRGGAVTRQLCDAGASDEMIEGRPLRGVVIVIRDFRRNVHRRACRGKADAVILAAPGQSEWKRDRHGKTGETPRKRRAGAGGYPNRGKISRQGHAKTGRKMGHAAVRKDRSHVRPVRDRCRERTWRETGEQKSDGTKSMKRSIKQNGVRENLAGAELRHEPR